MILVLLYGPPAAGKLTVARELARRTGFRLLHNHLTIDLAQEIFPERDEHYGELVSRLRLDVFEAAARAGISLISTYVYAAHSDDDVFLGKITDLFERHGGKVANVQLLPTREALRKRVGATSREAFAKIKDWSFLEKLLDAHDLTTPVPGSMTLDNSEVAPDVAAALIEEWLREAFPADRPPIDPSLE